MKEKKYFTLILAAMIIIAFSIFSVVFSILKDQEENLEEDLLNGGGYLINPTDSKGPSGPPMVPTPAYPPPEDASGVLPTF